MCELRVLLIIVFSAFVLWFSGCRDQAGETHFIVENRLDSTILIGIEMSSYLEDTSFVLRTDSSLLVDARIHARQVQDYVIDGLFPHISAQLVHSEETLDKDFSKREEWEYTEIDDYYAIYTLMIDESDLNSSDD